MTELAILATALADSGDLRAVSYADQLRRVRPAEAEMVLALYDLRRNNFDDAAKRLSGVFTTLRRDPWPFPALVTRSLNLAPVVAQRASDGARRSLYASLQKSFSVAINDDHRLDTLLRLAAVIEGKTPAALSREAFHNFEPHVPWIRTFLQARAECYRATGDPRAAIAAEDLRSFLDQEALPFAAGL